MPLTMHDILHPGNTETDKRFPNAPVGWTTHDAETVAAHDGLELTEEHWQVVRVLQSVYAENQHMPVRMTHAALEAHFSAKGGRRYLYSIFTGGPVIQGCHLAGLKPPKGITGFSCGSVS